jgi:hypothetical protein
MFFTFLRLAGFLLASYISLKHGLHEGHALITPKLLVGLLGGLRGFTSCYLEGLTIAVKATAVQGVVGLEGTTVGFATLAELASEVQSKMIIMGHQISSCHVPVVRLFFIL